MLKTPCSHIILENVNNKYIQYIKKGIVNKNLSKIIKENICK